MEFSVFESQVENKTLPIDSLLDTSSFQRRKLLNQTASQNKNYNGWKCLKIDILIFLWYPLIYCSVFQITNSAQFELHLLKTLGWKQYLTYFVSLMRGALPSLKQTFTPPQDVCRKEKLSVRSNPAKIWYTDLVYFCFNQRKKLSLQNSYSSWN